MPKSASLVRLFAVSFGLWLLLLCGLADAQSTTALYSVPLAPGSRCGFLNECSQFDEIGLHIGTGAAFRTDSSRSYWDAQGALRLSLTALNLAEGGVAFAGHVSSEGAGGLSLVSSPVLLYARLRLLPFPLGRLALAPLRLALTYQHDLVAGPFGQNEPPGFSRGTLRLVAGESLGRLDLDGHVGFVLARLDASRPRPMAFDLGASASIWLWRSTTGQGPGGELRLTAEALARFSLSAAVASEQNVLVGLLGQTASGYGGGVAIGTQVVNQQAGFLAVLRLQVSWGKQHKNPWAERKAAEPKNTPEFIWKLLGAIDPVVGTDGCVWTDATPERPSTQWFCIGTPAPDDPSQIVIKGGVRIPVGTHLWELGSTLRLDDGTKVVEIPLLARFRKAVWDYVDKQKRQMAQDRASYHRQVCEGKFNILHGTEKDPGTAAMVRLDDFGAQAALLGAEMMRHMECDPNPSDEEQALMAMNLLSMARAHGPMRARSQPAGLLGEPTEVKAPNSGAGGATGSAPASSFTRTESLGGGASSRQINDMAAEMQKNGWTFDPVLVVEHNGQRYIIDGHHRLEAARRAGVEVPYKIATPEEMARFNYKTIDDVIHAAAEAGPNRLRR